MRIKKLELKNFRGFEELTIDFPEGESGLAVFVGVNGAGKTSIAEGIALLLNMLNNKIYGFKDDFKVINSDVNIKSNVATGILYLNDETMTSFSLRKTSILEKPQLTYSVQPEFTLIEAGIDEIGLSNADLHLLCYYPATRVVPKQPSLKTKDISRQMQYDAYVSAFERYLDYSDFFEWFRNTEDYENEQRLYSDSDYRDRNLKSVRIAISSFLDGFLNPRIRRQPIEEMVIEKNGLLLSIGKLSSGEKSMIALFGDIARRMCLANPNIENPLLGDGVIIIDEIERHLHPGWQRMIIPKLRQTFPNIQFIVTTHSPQVLSNVPRESVFISSNFKLEKNKPHTEGRDSNAILEDVFGVPSRPEEEKNELDLLFDAIEKNDKKKADKYFKILKEKLGERDLELKRAESYMDVLLD